MRSSKFTQLLAVLAGCVALGWAPSALAQYPYPYPAYPGGVYAPYAGAGGYMAGQAQVIGSVGNFQTQQQDAQILNQKALQEQVKTQKMQFDQKQYEAKNTPTFREVQNFYKSEKEKRILQNPDPSEVYSGKALNVLLPYLQDLSNHGVQGPPVPVSAAVLDRINVVPPLATGGAGVLKNGGMVDFPIMLRGPTQKQLSEMLPQVVSSCVNGSLDFKTYKELRGTLDQLREEHKKKFHKEEIDGGTYIIGKRFLDSLDDSVKMLEQPNAAQLFAGAIRPKGGNVPEIVYNMTKDGLKFGPPIPGDEAAYASLHSSFVSYAAAAQNPSGFQVQLGPAHQQGVPIKKN
jgi:hypothetical protein